MGNLFPNTFRESILQLPEFEDWEQVSVVAVPEDVHHPQGLIKIGQTFYLTTVDKKKDRGLLLSFALRDGQLRTLSRLDITQGPKFRRYHPGGVDYLPSTQELWIPLAEYAPKKPTTVIAVKLPHLSVRVVGELDDHIGSVICDEEKNLIRLTNWDTEGIYTAELDENKNLRGPWKDFLYQPHLSYFRNPIWGRHGRFAYQDFKSLGQGFAIGTGVRRGIAWQHGVIDLISFGDPNVESFELVRRWTPGPVKSPFQRALFSIPLTRNPMMLEPIEDGKKVRLYFMPHDGKGSCLFIYEATLKA